jgi:hypothetical protein
MTLHMPIAQPDVMIEVSSSPPIESQNHYLINAQIEGKNLEKS